MHRAIMMDFSMRFLKNKRNSFLFTFVARCFAFAMMLTVVVARADDVTTTISSMQLIRTDDGLQLSAQVKFDLPMIVEDVLIKGIPLYFVAEADVTRDRWYWTDKKVASEIRQMRLSFQPLTRRWRLNVTNGVIGNTGLGISLPQYFDSLPDVLASIQRISHWKIADSTEVEADIPYTVGLRFKLDVSQLPRPFQIGLIGHSDWNIAAAKTMRLASESAK